MTTENTTELCKRYYGNALLLAEEIKKNNNSVPLNLKLKLKHMKKKLNKLEKENNIKP